MLRWYVGAGIYMRALIVTAALLCSAVGVGCSGSVSEPGFRTSDDSGTPGSGGEGNVVRDPNGGAGGHSGMGGFGMGGSSGMSGSSGAGGSPATGGSGGTGGAIAPPGGLVPMFVAVGRGGRTMTSCDDGHTWINDRQLSSDNSDHGEETDKGFAYGDGKFIQLLGWGTPRSLQISEDGIAWQRVYPAGTNWATIGFVGDTFMMMKGTKAVKSNTPDGAWVEVTEPGCDTDQREGGGGGPPPGIMVGACGAARYTTDQGQSWRTATACAAADSFGGTGHRGGFVFGAGVFLVMDDEGDYCSTADMGATWRSGSISNFRAGPIDEVGKVFFANGEFWAMVGLKGHHSADGVNWSTTEFRPAGTSLQAIAASDSGTYVAYDRNTSRFYRSTDAEFWELTSTRSATPTFQRLRFGYGRPSDDCRLP